MPEGDNFKEDFNSFFWLAALASSASLIGMDNDGLMGWFWLGLGGFGGLIWLSALMLGGSYGDKRKTYQLAIPWFIWGVLGAVSGIAAFIGFKAGVAWIREANLSPATQIIIWMLAVIIVELFYINLELERIRKRPQPRDAAPPR